VSTLANVTRDGRPGGPHEHVCFCYDDDAALSGRARRFLADGAAAGSLLWWVGDSPPPEGFDTHVVPIGTAYASGVVVDPDAQVRAYAAATGAALAAGFTGLRVVAEATALVRTPEQLDAFARYELMIDGYMATHPFSAMCAYDRRVLAASAIAELACLHTSTNAHVPFRLHGCAPADGDAVLAGELDMDTEELLEAALRRFPCPAGDEVVLKATGLRFADHRTLWRLDRWAAEHDRRLVLRGAPDATARVVELLGLEVLRVEPAA
jgi:hypothetical protein